MSRIAFYWKKQRGVCWLMWSPDCKDVNGFMDIRAPHSPRRATWDHLVPRSKRGKDPHNVLLACSDCNARRGTTPAPPEAIERARQLWDDWLAHCLATAAPPEPKKRSKREKQPQTLAVAQMMAATLEIEDEVGRRELMRIARNNEFLNSGKRSA